MDIKEYAYRVEVKYYDEQEGENVTKYLFCAGPDNSEIDALDLAYQRHCDKEPDLSKYSVIKYEFHKQKNHTMDCVGQKLSLEAFDYSEVYS